MNLSLHLVSDLDGTWIPGSEQPSGLADLEAFLASQPGIVLTFATGRSLPSALHAIAGWGSLLPRHFITDVGTALYHRKTDGTWAEDVEYALWARARWDPRLLLSRSERWIPQGVHPQPGIDAPRRIALQVEPSRSVESAVVDLRKRFDDLGMVADVQAAGRCIDVLPRSVHKGAAAAYLESRWGCPKPMVACGDSENDLSLFHVADRPLLMADSPLTVHTEGMPAGRMHRAATPGPAGILAFLISLQRECEGVHET